MPIFEREIWVFGGFQNEARESGGQIRVNGKNGTALVEENEVNIRQYAKYLLKEGSVSDKRELLANLRSKLIYKNKNITLV
mgnify:FL=1